MLKSTLKIFLCLLFVSAFCTINTVSAGQIVLKNNGLESFEINHPLYLIDNHQNLTTAFLLKNDHFKPSKFPTLSLGVTTAAVWIKTNVKNQSSTTNWFIQIQSPPVLQTVEVYQKTAGKLIKIFASDAAQAKLKEQVKVNNLLIPIAIPQNAEVEYFIRVSSNNILRVPLKIVTLENALEAAYQSDLLNGVIFGMLIAFAIYNFFVYILTKERPYLYYLGYIFLWSLNLFFYNGFFSNIFPSLIGLNSAGIIIGLASIWSVLFTNSFLQIKKYSPFFYNISGLMGLLSLLILITDIFWKGPYAFMIIQYLMYPFFIYWLGAGIACLKNGYKPALYFILGFGCLMLGNAVYNLKDLNILPDNWFTQSSMHWGTLLEALILSFALASRLSFYQKDKQRIQLKSIEEKRTFLKELLHRQEKEKKRVALELHDNIGQQLILIKNKYWRLQKQSEEPVKGMVSQSITHIAEIMGIVRSILHRLRPYQMDLLGLTESINGMVVDSFVNYDLEIKSSENINDHFGTDQSMHIFRIMELLTVNILACNPSKNISYSMVRSPSGAYFEFEFEMAKQYFDVHIAIYNRLELLKGNVSTSTKAKNTLIQLNIPRAPH